MPAALWAPSVWAEHVAREDPRTAATCGPRTARSRVPGGRRRPGDIAGSTAGTWTPSGRARMSGRGRGPWRRSAGWSFMTDAQLACPAGMSIRRTWRRGPRICGGSYAAGSHSTVVGGWFEGAAPAVLLAATDPEPVRGLVWWNPTPRTTWTQDYPWGWGPDEVEAELAGLKHWGTIGGKAGRPVRCNGRPEASRGRDSREAKASRNTCTPDVATAWPGVVSDRPTGRVAVAPRPLPAAR